MYDATPASDKQIVIGPGKVRTLVESFIRAHSG
jgi:hypothetical protein